MANWSLEETGAVKTISIFVSVHQRRRMRLLNGIRYDEQKNIILNFIILQQINNTTREKITFVGQLQCFKASKSSIHPSNTWINGITNK